LLTSSVCSLHFYCRSADSGEDSDYGIVPKRIYSSTFMTSLNGNGFSITLLRIVDTGLGAGKDMITLLDAAHETLGWTSAVKPTTWKLLTGSEVTLPLDDSEKIPTSQLTMDTAHFSRMLSSGLQKLIAAEPELTRYDSLVGDGDCGTGLRRGAEAVQAFISTGDIPTDPVATISHLATLVEENMDGTSGALCSIYLNALVKALRDNSKGNAHANVAIWAEAAMTAMKELGRYTPAQPGDRTMMDALQPFLVELEKGQDLKRAAEKARAGAESTRGMAPKLGRTVYIDKVGDIPDPGAVGIAVLVEGLAGI